MKKQGWRKVIILTESLTAFCALVITLKPTDPSVILAMGFSIGGLVGATIYGNIQEWKQGNVVSVPKAPPASIEEIKQ
jgi:hypothetical protein